MSFLILIGGAPATGKTSFAEYLSQKMQIPIVSKDIIKEHFYDAVGFKSREEKVNLGKAATEVMYYFTESCLKAGKPIILENNFENASKPGLERLINLYKCRTLTIVFYAQSQALYDRFIERDKSPLRHKGHVTNMRYPIEEGEEEGENSVLISVEEFQKALEQRGMTDFSVGGDRIMVDTTDFSKVSYDNIVTEIREKLSNYLQEQD